MPSPKQAKKYYYINNSKQRVTVSISNQSQGVIATTTVEHISTDHTGYTVATHTVFEDFCKRLKLSDPLLRVTKKVIQEWESILDKIYEKYLSQIQEQYPNTN